MTYVRRVWLALLCSAAMIGSIYGQQRLTEAPRFTIGVCQREGTKFVGTPPIEARGKIGLPKKIKNVRPQFPALPPGTKVRGYWIGEVLVDRDGKIVNIWTLTEPELTPPFPAFSKAIVDAVRQWEYEESMLPKVGPTPLCRTVVITPQLK